MKLPLCVAPSPTGPQRAHPRHHRTGRRQVPSPDGEVVPGELSDRKKFLLVVGREDIAAWKSVQNLDGVHPIAPDQLNTYDVLNSDDVVFSLEALNTFIAARQNEEESK